MLTKVNLVGSPQTRPGAMEEKLGCYRLWARPKAPRKAVRSRQNHMVLGPYLLSARR
jgi:hypothetical protein